jgi:drug/metabolite transporter (DMT)-like permease
MTGLIGRSRVPVAFAAIYAIWGSTYLAVALALQSLPPLLLVGARSLAAGLILLGIEWSRAGSLPTTGDSLAYAQQYVPSGLAAVIFATVPFWFALLNFAAPVGRRPNIASLFGLIPGLAGVALIAWRPVAAGSNAIEPAMVLLLLGSALSWAAGSLLGQRRATGVSAIALAGMQLMCGGAALLAASGLLGEWKAFTPGGISAVSWAGFAYLTLAGSVIALTAYLWLLDHVSGSAVTTYTFITPIMAVLLGWVFLGERLNALMLLGTTLVIGSVVLVWRLEAKATGEHVPDARIRGDGASSVPIPKFASACDTSDRNIGTGTPDPWLTSRAVIMRKQAFIRDTTLTSPPAQ